ncbi:MAG: tRNA lysidine(34) synthetase TilS, partial [Burkholderiales bacterium]|nr:tRNA lysidine(34) synthetase TilS [Burkholderiales bacterium]
MAHTRRLKSNNPDAIIDDVREVLQAYVKRDNNLVVGLSGGVDSVVLLDVLATLSGQMAFKLSAVHVNHGISSNAADWSHSCCQLCYAYGVPISVFYLKIKKAPGTSLEALARDERYRIFDRLYGDYLVLAQHQDDQAETVLLQL